MRISRASGRHRPELISLFEAIASARADLPLTGFTPGTIGWAIQSGLGPLLYRAGKDNAHNSTSGLWTDLKAADLTARVIMAEHLEAMCEIIDACDGRLPLTLLKGISIAEEYYPEPHLRLMRDIDILLPKQYFPAVKTVLEQLGYRQEDHPAALYANHHHAAPFFHEEKNVWVEVHHALIAPRRRAGSAAVFQGDAVASQLRDTRFQGRKVRRLSPEMELIYLATHWSQDFPGMGGMVAMVDAIYLLKTVGFGLRWDWIIRSVPNSFAASHLYLLLHYLERQRLLCIPGAVMHELFLHQPSFGRATLAAARAMLDRYCVTGRPMGRLLNKGVALTWNALMVARPTLTSLMHAHC